VKAPLQSNRRHRNRTSDAAIFFVLVAVAAAGLHWTFWQPLALVPLSVWLSCRYGGHRLVARLRWRDRHLHDALLQNVQGLVLHFQAVKELISEQAVRDMMEQALMLADKVLIDSREQAAKTRAAD
jgi:threonine/homoserine efflux transporter RhtA